MIVYDDIESRSGGKTSKNKLSRRKVGGLSGVCFPLLAPAQRQQVDRVFQWCIPWRLFEVRTMRTETEIRPVARLRGGRWADVLCCLVYEVSWMSELSGEYKWRWHLVRIEELAGH